MTQPREKSFIWVSWLVDVASGKRACHWKYWFKARYNHDKRPTGFDASGWKLKHTRMLTDLRRTLVSEGHRMRTEVPMTLRMERMYDQGQGRLRSRTAVGSDLLRLQEWSG